MKSNAMLVSLGSGLAGAVLLFSGLFLGGGILVAISVVAFMVAPWPRHWIRGNRKGRNHGMNSEEFAQHIRAREMNS